MWAVVDGVPTIQEAALCCIRNRHTVYTFRNATTSNNDDDDDWNTYYKEAALLSRKNRSRLPQRRATALSDISVGEGKGALSDIGKVVG